MVLSGELERPERQVGEVRTVFRELSLMFMCRWRDAAGRVWQDIPVTPEMMASMGHQGALSDEDRAAMAASYVRQQVAALQPLNEQVVAAQPRKPWWRFS